MWRRQSIGATKLHYQNLLKVNSFDRKVAYFGEKNLSYGSIMILNNLKRFLKNRFLTKNVIFLQFLRLFDLTLKYRFFVQNPWKMAVNTFESFSKSPNIFQIHWMMLYDGLRAIEKIAKNFHSHAFPLLRPQKRKYVKMVIFCDFFNLP